MSPTVQWQAVAGVTHAWIAQCEGYVSLCGREVRGFHGQLSGIRCASCTASSGWAQQTGQASYLTPHEPDAMSRDMGLVRGVRPKRRKVPLPEPIMVPEEEPIAQRPKETQIVEAESREEETTLGSKLIVPESMEGYRALSDAEQRYWAPVLLARTGRAEVWDQAQETAEQFQQRCYEALMKGPL